MDEEQVLATYEGIARVTRQMLAAARGDDWDRLIALEQDCNTRFAWLYTHPNAQPLSLEFGRRKAELIRGVLEDDAHIRLLVQPWLVRLGALIGNTQRQKQLNTAYQSGA